MNLCQCGCGSEIPLRSKNRGEPLKFKHGHNKGDWKGGKIINSQGYILIQKPDHHFANLDGYVREHRLVWENYNNASLLSWVDIHHINGNKTDNRIENLKVIGHSQHTLLHHALITI